MGAVHVDVTIRNPADPSRSWRSRFLAGTGATNTMVPPECIEAVGLASDGRRTHRLMDGRRVEADVAVAKIELLDEFVGGTVVTGEPGVEPLLGLTALQSMGVEVDVARQELRKLPAVRLKPVRRLSRTASPASCSPKG